MKKALIVDDETTIRKGLRALMERNKTIFEDIRECENGEEALALLQQETFSLLITDIRMPVMDGLSLIRKMQSLPEKPATIILSGYEDFHYAAEAMKYQVRAYLLKPVDIQEFLQTLASVEAEFAEDDEPETEVVASAEQKNEVKAAITYIADNFAKNLNLSTVANQVSMNYYYFSHLFKEQTGMSFVDYVKKVRIDKAKELLDISDLKIFEVGERVGYKDYKQFTKIFHHVVGMTPREYKNKRDG